MIAGRLHQVRVRTHPCWRTLRIRVDDRGIMVTAPARTSTRYIRAALKRHHTWMEERLAEHALNAAPNNPRAEADARRRARPFLVGLVERWSAVVGVTPARVTIRDQRTRWGSASTRGTISLNWRLLLAPPQVAEYVVVHELCHLVHMDHSAAFWALVESHLPDYRTSRDWLRTDGQRLLAGRHQG